MNRRPVKALTSVPEQERSIKHRLEIVLVGAGAEDFAQRAVDSEEAAAYTPKTHVNHTPGQDLTVFCPCEESEGTLLARLRLKPIELFSQSLPLPKNEEMANTIVVFLVWRSKLVAIGDRLTDFQARMAEINFLPAKRRPCLALVGFKVNDAEEQALREFSDRWQHSTIECFFYEDVDEDTIMDALRNISDKIISSKQRRLSGSFYPSITQASSSICTLL